MKTKNHNWAQGPDKDARLRELRKRHMAWLGSRSWDSRVAETNDDEEMLRQTPAVERRAWERISETFADDGRRIA